MHDRLLKMLLAYLDDIDFYTPVWLWYTPKTEQWNISTDPKFDRRFDKVILIDRSNAEKSISNFLYQQQPPHQRQD